MPIRRVPGWLLAHLRRQLPEADLEAHVQGSIQRLEYDFSRFTVQDFVHHISVLRARDIVLMPYPFGHELHGLFMRAETADYVFYNDDGHPIHKVHNILHELGHIILNHPGLPLDTLLAENPCALQAHFRKVIPSDSREEQEAEVFVRYLQRQIIFANQMEQLTGCSSSIDDVAKFTRNLGYHD